MQPQAGDQRRHVIEGGGGGNTSSTDGAQPGGGWWGAQSARGSARLKSETPAWLAFVPGGRGRIPKSRNVHPAIAHCFVQVACPLPFHSCPSTAAEWPSTAGQRRKKRDPETRWPYRARLAGHALQGTPYMITGHVHVLSQHYCLRERFWCWQDVLQACATRPSVCTSMHPTPPQPHLCSSSPTPTCPNQPNVQCRCKSIQGHCLAWLMLATTHGLSIHRPPTTCTAT